VEQPRELLTVPESGIGYHHGCALKPGTMSGHPF
jgi:hypothetical protein